MQMVKIQFTNETEQAKRFVALARKVRVVCLPNDPYEVAKSPLKILDDLGISCQVLTEEGFDHACR